MKGETMKSGATETVKLINEAKRAWSFPALPLPEEKPKLNERGKPRLRGEAAFLAMPEGAAKMRAYDSFKLTTELESLKRFRPPMLEPGKTIVVPGWYLTDLLRIRAWKRIMGARDGISIGVSVKERVQKAHIDAAAAVASAEFRSRAESAEARVRELEAELAKK